MIFELASLRYLLMLTIGKLAWFKIISALLLLIGTMSCFLKGYFMVMLIFGLIVFDLLLILLISMILLENRVGNVFFICKTSSTLIFKVWAYDFLLLMGLNKEVCVWLLIVDGISQFDFIWPRWIRKRYWNIRSCYGFYNKLK